MSSKINELIDAIRDEARIFARDELARTMVESSEDIWAALIRFCGEREASRALMCLLQRAAEAGAVEAVRFATNADDDFETIQLKHGFDDELSFTISDEIWLRVTEKSNAPHEGPARASCAGPLDAVVGRQTEE